MTGNNAKIKQIPTSSMPLYGHMEITGQGLKGF